MLWFLQDSQIEPLRTAGTRILVLALDSVNSSADGCSSLQQRSAMSAAGEVNIQCLLSRRLCVLDIYFSKAKYIIGLFQREIRHWSAPKRNKSLDCPIEKYFIGLLQREIPHWAIPKRNTSLDCFTENYIIGLP